MMPLRRSVGIVATFRSSNFAKAATVLIGGTALAQAVSACAMPIITRLYSPAEMSVLASFTSATALASVAACGRFDIAISVARNERQASNLVALALCYSLVTSLLLLFVTLWCWHADLKIGALSASSLLLLPVATIILSWQSTAQFLMVRAGRFRRLAIARFAQAGIAAGSQIALAIQNMGVAGLTLGYTLGYAAALGLLSLGRSGVQSIKGIRLRRMAAMHRRHRNYPLFSAPEALLNAGSLAVPILLIAAYGRLGEAGQLALALYALQVPIGLIGNAIGQLYLAEAPRQHRAGALFIFTLTMTRKLALLGAPMILSIGLASPFVFPVIFGAEWQRAGTLTLLFAPSYLLQLLVSPVSSSLLVIDRQRVAFVLQLCGLVLRTGTVCAALALFAGRSSEALAVSSAAFYGLYLLVVLIELKRINFIVRSKSKSKAILCEKTEPCL